jgi:hypothetical protein
LLQKRLRFEKIFPVALGGFTAKPSGCITFLLTGNKRLRTVDSPMLGPERCFVLAEIPIL